MRLRIARSKWDMDDLPLDRFLGKIAAAGFDASDIHIPSLRESPEAAADLHARHGMSLVAMITTEGRTPEEHCASLRERFALAARCNPVLINCHTGRDTFSREGNLAVFRESLAL
ncbi:MAG TPA: hypothetical protein VK569_10095, partial [Bacteroidota bacterium]|nr:hypothetical protein [Bacteroidota bacterium]